jgi:WD40 repeat protein
VHDFKEHSLEITAMTWSQDGTKVATSSLDSRIVIVDVVKRTVVKSIECANKVVGIIWDPFDKYLACLCFDNVVMVWKVVSWELCSSISLNFPNISTTYTSKREDRKIDWSPDFRYLLVPSLDDRVVPVVCALDRH